MSILEFFKRPAILGVVAGGLCFGTPTNLRAADCDCGCELVEMYDATCGCETGCNQCLSISCEQCNGGRPCDGGLFEKYCPKSPRLKNNIAYKALDGLAGGIEKLLRLDRCGSLGCDEVICDDGCDAAMIDDLMMPIPSDVYIPAAPVIENASPTPTAPRSVPSQQFHQHAPMPPASAPTVSVPQVAQPRTQMRMGQPQVIDHMAPRGTIETLQTQPLQTQPRGRAVPPPVRVPGPEPRTESTNPRPVPVPDPVPATEGDGGSLFESLSDPFGDDVRVKRYQPVRPSSYQSSNRAASVGRRTLSRNSTSSSRRVNVR